MLESDHGRFFIDAVLKRTFNGATLGRSIDAEAARWMRRKTERVHQREYGIPVGLSYLEAFVIHYSALEYAR